MDDRETLAFGFVDEVFVVLHSSDEIAERDWRACVDQALSAAEVPAIVWVTNKAAPDVTQRHDLISIFEKHGSTVAIMSDDPLADRAVTALGWAGMTVKRFAEDDLDGMLAFLEHTALRARVASAIGPYLDRIWLVQAPAPEPTRSARPTRSHLKRVAGSR